MEKQILIITVGYPGSGKSTLVAQLKKEFPSFNIVNGDPFRDLMRKEMPYFNTLEFSEMTPSVERANAIAKEYKRMVLDELIRSGQSALMEGNHLERGKRDKWFSGPREINPNILTVILYLKIDTEDLIERYKQRDVKNSGSVWVSEFKKWRKEQLEEPTEDEADELIIFNQNNYDEVISKIRGLLVGY